MKRMMMTAENTGWIFILTAISEDQLFIWLHWLHFMDQKTLKDFCLKGGGTSMVEGALPVYRLVQACPSSVF